MIAFMSNTIKVMDMLVMLKNTLQKIQLLENIQESFN